MGLGSWLFGKVEPQVSVGLDGPRLHLKPRHDNSNDVINAYLQGANDGYDVGAEDGYDVGAEDGYDVGAEDGYVVGNVQANLPPGDYIVFVDDE